MKFENHIELDLSEAEEEAILLEISRKRGIAKINRDYWENEINTVTKKYSDRDEIRYKAYLEALDEYKKTNFLFRWMETKPVEPIRSSLFIFETSYMNAANQCERAKLFIEQLDELEALFSTPLRKKVRLKADLAKLISRDEHDMYWEGRQVNFV